jgi:hypothetical protein
LQRRVVKQIREIILKKRVDYADSSIIRAGANGNVFHNSDGSDAKVACFYVFDPARTIEGRNDAIKTLLT